MDANGNVLSESKFDQEGELERNTTPTPLRESWEEHVLLFAVEDVTERRVLKRNEKGLLWKKWNTMEMMQVNARNMCMMKRKHYRNKSDNDEEGDFDVREEMKYDDKGSLIERTRIDKTVKLWSVFLFD